MQAKLEKKMQTGGIDLDAEDSIDFQQIMVDHEDTITSSFEPGSFQSIFWEQQKKGLALSNSRGMRWHPLMIKWCLYLRHQSSKAYELIRDSGVIKLPSQRTLRDYSNSIKAKPGYSRDVDYQLMIAANIKSCPEWHNLVILLLDEMYIKEGLVYDKHSGSLTGFTDLGNINNHLVAFERSLQEDADNTDNNTNTNTLASSIFTIMVKGLFTPLRFPYAHFPCTSLSGDLLFQPFWEAVFRLERMDFKVHVNTFLSIYMYIHVHVQYM